MILVVGATGNVGGMVSRRLLEQGKQVRILVREGSSYQPLADAGAEPVFGDLKDKASLAKACEGVDTVVTTANSASRSGDDNVGTVDTEGNRNLIDAAKEAGVKHFVFTSVMGISEDSPVPLFQAKAKTEAYLRNSSMDYTIVAPNLFIEYWVYSVVGQPLQEGNAVTLVGQADHRHTFISAADAAAFLSAAVDNPDARNQHIVVTGPEALTYRDAVGTFERVLQRPIPVTYVPPGTTIAHLGEWVSNTLAALEQYETPYDMTDTASRYGVNQTRLEDAIRRDFGGT